MSAQHTPSAVFRYSLKAESGYSASGSAKISPEQYGQVMALINGKDDPVVTELLAALKEARRAIGDHFAPDHCYATGPITGNALRDLVECPACSAIAMYDAAIAKATGSAEG